MLDRPNRCVLVAMCGLALGSVVCPSVANAELVFNGGFETGNFTGWSWVPGPETLTQVDAVTPHSGLYSLQISSSSTTFDELGQSLATFPGQQYEISFWLRDGGLASPISGFEVWWEGTQVFGLGPIDVPASGYGQFAIPVTATGPGSLLLLRMYDAVRASYLDDVSVVAIPTPSAAAPLALVGCLMARRRSRSS